MKTKLPKSITHYLCMYICMYVYNMNILSDILRIFLLLHIIKTPKRSRYIVCYRFSMNMDLSFILHIITDLVFFSIVVICWPPLAIIKYAYSWNWFLPSLVSQWSAPDSVLFHFYFLTLFQMCTRTSIWWRRQWSSTALTLASSFCLGQFVRLPIKIRRRTQPYIPKRMASNHTPVDDEKTKRKITKQETRGKQKQKPPQHP